MTTHFLERVAERVAEVDPIELRKGLIWAIRNDRWDLVRFVCRADRNQRRWFEFATPSGKTFFALMDMDQIAPVTVYTPEMMDAWRAKASDIKRRKRR